MDLCLNLPGFVELTKTKVFDCCAGRSHPSFSKPRVPLHAKSEDELLDWIVTHIHFKLLCSFTKQDHLFAPNLIGLKNFIMP